MVGTVEIQLIIHFDSIADFIFKKDFLQTSDLIGSTNNKFGLDIPLV